MKGGHEYTLTACIHKWLGLLFFTVVIVGVVFLYVFYLEGLGGLDYPKVPLRRRLVRSSYDMIRVLLHTLHCTLDSRTFYLRDCIIDLYVTDYVML
jgi:hypothetical protein